MDEDTKTKIQERFRKLPIKIREAIQSSSFEEKLRILTERHRLHIDQGVTLENETLLVMLGLDDTADFSKNIEKELDISAEQANEITADVAKDILLPIRESLRELLEKENEEEDEIKTSEARSSSGLSGAPAPEDDGAPDKKKPVVDIATQKLNQTIQSGTKEVSMGKKEANDRPARQDPYREPIE